MSETPTGQSGAGTGRAFVLCGDARALPLPDASVDLIVTSPPYFGLRSYTDGGEHYEGQIGAEAGPAAYIDALIECTREWVRVLKPTGSIWVNLGDKYSSGGRASYNPDSSARRVVASSRPLDDAREKCLLQLPARYAIRCTDDLGLILRRDQIWSKPNGLPESVRDRMRSSHEYWFHLTREPHYYSALDRIREPSSTAPRYTQKAAGRAVPGLPPQTNMGAGGSHLTEANYHPLGRLPGSVWEIPTEPLLVPDALGIDHYAAFPTEWPRRLILGFCPEAGVVLDPFGGTGTTVLCAEALGRVGISVDLSADYCRLATWRTTDPAQRAKAMRVDKPAPVMDGQLDLLASAS